MTFRRLWALAITLEFILAASAMGATNLVKVTGTAWKQWFTPAYSYDYRYGPSLIIDSANSQVVDMWVASAPHGTEPGLDVIRHYQSTNGGSTWTDLAHVLQPTVGGLDNGSTCDPGAFKLGSYYYIGYGTFSDTSNYSTYPGPTVLCVARTNGKTGAYEKWNGRGWGGNPVPIVNCASHPSSYGIGEPTFVVYNSKLYMFYTNIDWDAQTGETHSYTDLAISDSLNDDWPARLVYQGHVLKHDSAQSEDSVDIKYVDSMSRFIAIATHERFGGNSTPALWQSEDGIKWQRAPYAGAPVQPGAHNIGITGMDNGHLDTTKSNFISYSYNPVLDGSDWGHWPSYQDTISLGTVALGSAVFAEASSLPVDTVNHTEWNYNEPRLIDGNTATFWASKPNAAAASVEWAGVDLGANLTVSALTVTPKSGGACFPEDFQIQTSTDASNWTTRVTLAGQAQATTAQTYTFTAVTARYVRIYATKLRISGSYYYLQLAELSATASAPSQPGAFALGSPASGATNASTQPTLSWGASSGATAYSLYVSETSNMSNPVFSKLDLTATSFNLTSLAPSVSEYLKCGKTYYWKVVAWNGWGYRDCTAVYSFTTAAAEVRYAVTTKTTASSSYTGWEAGRAIDWSNDTCWSSTLYSDNANHTEWLMVNLGAANPIKEVHLVPRTGGLGFPVRFKIETSSDSVTWATFYDGTGSDYTNPGGTLQNFSVGTAQNAQYVRVTATKLYNEGGSYHCQFAEVHPVYYREANAAETPYWPSSGSATSVLSGWPVSNVWDNNASTCWSSNYHGTASGYTESIQVYTGGSFTQVRGIRVTPRSDGYCFPQVFKFRYSFDGTTWYDVPGESYSSYANPNGVEQVFFFSSVIYAAYIKMEATTLRPDGYGNYYFQVADMKLIPYATGGRLAAPRHETAYTSASSQLSGWEPIRVIDGKSSTRYSSVYHGSASATEVLQIDLGGYHRVKRIRLLPRIDADGYSYCFPTAFTLEYSMDNVMWTVIPGLRFSNLPRALAGELTFCCPSPVPARYVRLRATTLSPDPYSGYYLQLAEFNADWQ